MQKVAIIGGGITGLSAAYYLSQSDDFQIDVYEKDTRLGGKIKTYRKDGYTIELGPESYLSRKKELTELAEEIGMSEDIVRNQTGTAYVYVNDKLSPIPKGTMLGIPTEIKPFITTDIISPLGKIRALGDLIIPRIRMNSDISAGRFFRKRLGNEVVDHLIDPLLSGVYSTSIDELSLMSTFPMFKESEEKHGSLILGMLKRKQPNDNKNYSNQTKKVGQFFQFKNGLESFIEKLSETNESNGVNIHLDHELEAIDYKDKKYELTINGTKTVYDKVIITTPHFLYKKWLKDLPLEYFKYMKATSVATVVMAFDESQVTNDLDGTGFVVSKKQDTAITACTWTNKKWLHSTPEGKVLLRAYVGRPGEDDVNHLSDEEILERARKDLDKIMTINGEPEFYIVTTLKHSMPNYTVGHKDRVSVIEAYMEEMYPGLKLIGASHYAVGLPDCVKVAKKTAEQMIQTNNAQSL